MTTLAVLSDISSGIKVVGVPDERIGETMDVILRAAWQALSMAELSEMVYDRGLRDWELGGSFSLFNAVYSAETDRNVDRNTEKQPTIFNENGGN